MAHGLTEAELDELSDAERAALEDDDDLDEDEGGNGNGNGNGNDDDDDDDDENGNGNGNDDDDENGGGEKIEGGEKTTEGESIQDDASGSDDDDRPEFRPAPALSIDEAHAKLADLEAKKADLRTKLNDGDLALDEYTEQYDALAKEERAAERAVWQAEQAQQIDKQRWDWEQEQFFNAKENAVYKDKYLLTALDAAIKDLAKDPANGGKKGPWFLAEADKMIRQRFNMQPAAGERGNPDKARRARPNPPPTLAGMPAAEHPDTGGGDEFAHLDRLDGFDLEAALAKLTPEQQNRYLGIAG